MKAITVYRIEHPTSGIGFLRHFSQKERIADKRLHKIIYNHNKFPNPENEGLQIIDGLHKCSFRTLTIMLDNVEVRDIKFLVRKYKFKVYEIVVNSKEIGEMQVLYSEQNIITKKNITNQFR